MRRRARRLVVARAVLWAVAGAAVVATAFRLARGLGATTALTDATPWGLWVGFDVLAGIALAASGFVIPVVVVVFHKERYRELVRPALLTALLGYMAEAVGLIADLGRPWNIWRPVFFWQVDSPLFLISWCVMICLAVLTLELSPAVLERLGWTRLLRLARAATTPLVVLGAAVAVVHQSTLGSLFLLTSARMHPLWYSPTLPVQFLLSAVALGFVVVMAESSLSSWLFHRRGEWHVLRSLRTPAVVTLGLYLALRLGDLVVRGVVPSALDRPWIVALFFVEIFASAVVPLFLFLLPAARRSDRALAAGAVLAVGGFILHRATVGGIAHIPLTGDPYLPALTEIMISAGLLAGMGLALIAAVENLPMGHGRTPAQVRASTLVGAPERSVGWLARCQAALLCSTGGAMAGVVLVVATTWGSWRPERRPVSPASPIAVQWGTFAGSSGGLRLVALAMSEEGPGPGYSAGFLIDGARTGQGVVFPHEMHQQMLGGESSCARCHHRTDQAGRPTTCARCHADMFQPSASFEHGSHVAELGGNESCARCHEASGGREAGRSCRGCHEPGHRLGGFGAPAFAESAPGLAPGYRESMHRLCLSCHEAHDESLGLTAPRLGRCGACHRGYIECRTPAAAPRRPVEAAARPPRERDEPGRPPGAGEVTSAPRGSRPARPDGSGPEPSDIEPPSGGSEA